MVLTEKNAFSIRPAGRHILTIGRDLIQDPYAAVVELVKNAFDADSKSVDVEFVGDNANQTYHIVIADHGHGMSRDDVIQRWMVPSTTDKLKRKTSPKGRILQGRKGVGRFAASILGNDLLLETATKSAEKTSVFVDWDLFEKSDFLDEVELLIETKESDQKPGTKLTISGKSAGYKDWDEAQFWKLKYELRKLIPPAAAVSGLKLKQEKFDISLTVKGFEGVHDTYEVIEPFPILDFYDYKISGFLDEHGVGELRYSTQKIETVSDEVIKIDFSRLMQPSCGQLEFDIRVYDRDADDIDQLIKRGLKDKEGHYLGRLEARQLLNLNNGVGVFRNGFRIRPLGDAKFDWLELDKARVQNPSARIGSNQVIGFVHISSEENSNLIEKSARDGLRENAAYTRLIELSQMVIRELEKRRFSLRRSFDLGKPRTKVEAEIRELFSDDHVQKDIAKRLSLAGITGDVIQEVSEILDKDRQRKNKAADNIRQTVAVYQGQATLGKIINVVLHEGRRPLNYFKNQLPNLEYWKEQFSAEPDQKNLQKVISIVQGFGQNAEFFVGLFSRLDPLASGKRAGKKKFRLKREIEGVFEVFSNSISAKRVKVEIIGPENFELIGWQQDIYAIFTNLVDNSLFWLEEKNSPSRKIEIRFEVENDKLAFIDYRDSGPGIDESLIESEVIFDPEFSTKIEGTGLGLAIAGEAASRNDLELKVLKSDEGAYFRMQAKEED